MSWIAVTFITYGTPYEKEVLRLQESAAKFNVPLVTYKVAPRGSWRANLDWKSAIILRAMDELAPQDIVFLDADAAIRQFPAEFGILSESREYDIAACFFGGSFLEKGELLSGTLWIANTAAGREIVELWDRIGRDRHDVRHQKCLHLALRKLPTARIYALKPGYTRIYDHPGMRGVQPVIEHFQASRRLRSRVTLPRPAGPGAFPGLPRRGRV